MKLRDIVPSYNSEVQKMGRLDELIGFYDYLSKSSGDTGRLPTIGIDTIVNSWVRQQFAYREQLLEDLMTISQVVTEIRSPILHIRNEVFRRGLTWEPCFAKKCHKCGREYENIVEQCEDCKEEGMLKDPDEEQLEVVKTFLDDCNCFDQSFEEICKQLSYDINSVDDSYLYLAKEYIDDNGKTKSKPVEIRRLRPSAVEFDLDNEGLPKNKHWLCVFHRDLPPADIAGKCKKCDRELVPAMYVYRHRGKNIYLLDNEILHESKFQPSETYGFSPLLTLFEKALTLLGMDRRLFSYFYERKMPASMLLIATDDTDSIRRARQDIVVELRKDPDYIPMIGYSPKQGSRGRVDFIRLFHTLQEMDYIPVKNEIRERIAALWGLPPMWQSELTGMGGLASQSQQMVQFSRVVESDQRMFNEKIFPFVTEAFNITDWKLVLQQPEEKAEVTRIQFSQQRASTANMLKMMGFAVKVKPGTKGIDDLDFEVSGEVEGGAPGGMGGGFGGGESPFGMSQKGWSQQLNKGGYTLEQISDISVLQNGTTALSFLFKGQEYIALFNPMSELVEVCQKANNLLHQHDSYPPHDKNMNHSKGLDAKRGQEESIFKEEEDDEEE